MTSIIITYIDEHDYLADALESAAMQKHVEIEILVVCNAPTLPAGYEPLPNRTYSFTFIHEPVTGSSYARNTGLRMARGEWVQFLDVDDLLCPHKIHLQSAPSDADVVVSPHSYLYVSGKKETCKWLAADFWVGLMNSGLGSTSSMLWKREALLEVGGWHHEYYSHHEYELIFRLAVAGKKIVADDHCETIVRQRHFGSITQNTVSVSPREGIGLREAMWNFIREKGLETPERYDAFRQYIFRNLRGVFRQDRNEAMSVYRKYFTGHDFTPAKIHIPGYVVFYRMLGFYRLETILAFVARLRSHR